MGEELQRQHILPSIAHTDATYEEVEKANKAGYTHITHLYSAMSSVTRRNAFRHAGVVEAAYLIDDITVEIIADISPSHSFNLFINSKDLTKLHSVPMLCGALECQMESPF